MDPGKRRIYAQCFVPSIANTNSGNPLGLYCLDYQAKRWTKLKVETSGPGEELIITKVMAFWRGRLFLLFEKTLGTDQIHMATLRSMKSSLEIVSADKEKRKKKR